MPQSFSVLTNWNSSEFYFPIIFLCMISPPFTLMRKVKRFRLIDFIHHTLQGLNMTKIKYPFGNGYSRAKLLLQDDPIFWSRLMISIRSIVFWRKIPKSLLQEGVIYWAAIFQFVFPLGRILIGKGIFKDKKMGDFILLLCYKMLANKNRCRHFVTDSGKRWRRPKWIK